MPLPYHAGKASLSKEISDIILKEANKNENIKNYAEPFCGMMRVGLEVMKKSEEDKLFKKFYFSDVNKTITVFFKELHRGWLPRISVVTQDKWESYKKSSAVSAQKTFVGYSFGFGGQYFGGSKPRQKPYTKTFSAEWQKNYLKNRKENIKELQHHFTSSKFSIKEKSVFDLDFKNTIIYCDPPYIATAWRAKTKWDEESEEQFWDTVYKWLEPSKNNIVLVSNSEKHKRVEGLSIKTVFKKDHISQGSYRAFGDDRKRSEMLFKITRK